MTGAGTAGAAAGTGPGGTGITGSACIGSASAVGMLNVIAVTNPSAPDATTNAFASTAIFTDAPFPLQP
jgi:hypothetical protein